MPFKMLLKLLKKEISKLPKKTLKLLLKPLKKNKEI
jgi:hypothetical protein